MPKTNNMGTYTLAVGTYTIKADDGVRVIALKLSAGGAATVKGAAKIGDMGPSTPIALVVAEPTIFSNQDPMDNLVIDVTAGTVLVITNQ